MVLNDLQFTHYIISSNGGTQITRNRDMVGSSFRSLKTHVIVSSGLFST